jgi:hypothetical protein
VPRTSASQRLNALQRHRSADDPAVTEARRNLHAAKLEEHIRKVVDSAPALSADQRNRLALLLRGSGG